MEQWLRRKNEEKKETEKEGKHSFECIFYPPMQAYAFLKITKPFFFFSFSFSNVCLFEIQI
jgi:hypothetical protein